MLRNCFNLASSSGRTLVQRSFSTSFVLKQDNSQPNDVDKLFNAGSDDKRQRRSAFSMNRIDLIGGVANDPMVRVARTGNEYVSFDLFTNVDFRKPDGSFGVNTELHNIRVFGNHVNFVKQNVARGNRVYVSGRLHYEGGQDGRPRQATITADVVFPRSSLKNRDD